MKYASDAAKEGHIETMSLRQAARDLGVSSGAVYRHFADKDSLLVEIALLGFHDMREKFSTIRPEGRQATSVKDAVNISYSFCRTYIYFALENPALWHMMFGRVGSLARERLMADPELRRYTPFDAIIENMKDLYRLGAMDHEPDMDDVRYAWSATHGAADLAQSGARLDSHQVDHIVEQTHLRNLRATGCTSAEVQVAVS